MIHAARQLGCFDVQGVTGEADHTEEPGQSFGGALLGPVERGTLGIGVDQQDAAPLPRPLRSEEHTSELQSLMRISYAVFCLKKKKNNTNIDGIEDTISYSWKRGSG